jgi:hypothetical protein
MSSKATRAMKVFLGLSDSEKSEFIDQLNEYQKGDGQLRKSINTRVLKEESTPMVNFGPIPGAHCPYCGR